MENVFEGWTKVFEYHGIVLAFCSKPVNGWDAKPTCEALIHLVFMLKLRLLGIERLKLDSNFHF